MAGISVAQHVPALSRIAQWLKDGQWQLAHDAIQLHDSPMASWLHGILHLQEGDLEDAENWYERSGRHFRSRGDSWQDELAVWDAAFRRIADVA